ncbi:phage tail protein [Caproiciproducens galactitolivorans]|uniref:phage tail protein n=1 Tax=Caproiciproducens galactitolivorans TaxID=642589 RepID=UPI002409E8AD|nr:phage tail protein [Caproiciproducens galactitolivorans]
MATKEDNIKTKLALEGEKEYKAACRSINTSLREIGSEMKLVSAEFEGNAKSTEALTAKQEVLKKQLEEQANKVKAAEEALRKMKEGGLDETSPAIQKMQTNLNNAKAEMIQTEKQLNSISDELKKSKVNWEAVGSTLGTVAKGFGVALKALGVAAGAAAGALTKLTVDASNYADDLMTQSTYTRQSTDDLQKYAYACRFIDADMDTLTKTMSKNIKSMDAARGGTGATAEAYKKLGISVTNADGSLRDSNDVYWEAIDALGKIPNETERDAMAMQLFGKSAQELNSVIEAGSGAFKQLGDEAENVGAVMSGDQFKRLGEFNDKLQVLSASAEGLKNSASMIALPFLDVLATDGIKILGDFSKGINEANGDVAKMADVVGNGLADVVNLISEKLPEFVDMGVQMISSLVEGIIRNLPQIIDAAVKIILSLCNGILEMLPMVIDGAVQIIGGLLKGIGQALPQLIPKIVEVIVAIVQTIINNIPMLINAGLQVIIGLVQGVINSIPVLVAAIPQIITSLVNAVLEGIPQIYQAGIDLLTSLVKALPEIIAAIVEAIPQIINGIITAVINSIPQIIQAGIDLLVALIQALPQIITTIVNALPQIITAICDALIGNIDKIILAGVQLFVALIENLPTIIIEIVKAVPQIIEGIVSAFDSLMYKIVEIGFNLLKGIWEGISGAASWLWDKITGFFGGVVDGIKNFLGIHSPSTVFADIGDNMALGVGEGFSGSMDGVSGDMQGAIGGAGKITAEEAVRAVNDGIIANISKLDQAVTAIVERIVTGLTTQNQRLNSTGQDMDKYIASGMVTGVVHITAVIPQLVQSTITAFIAQHQNFINEGVDIDKSIASGMINGIPEITSKVPQIIQPVITALRSFVSDFTAAGEEMVRGIWQGFQNMSGWLESKVRSMMQQIVAAVRDEMQIASPSKVFAGIGEFMAAGLSEGFAKEMQSVEKSIRKETAETIPEKPSTSGRINRNERGGVQVVQNIYANETSYAKQQREAAKQFRMIAREVGI